MAVWPPVWEYEHAGVIDLESIDQRTHGERVGIECQGLHAFIKTAEIREIAVILEKTLVDNV